MEHDKASPRNDTITQGDASPSAFEPISKNRNHDDGLDEVLEVDAQQFPTLLEAARIAPAKRNRYSPSNLGPSPSIVQSKKSNTSSSPSQIQNQAAMPAKLLNAHPMLCHVTPNTTTPAASSSQQFSTANSTPGLSNFATANSSSFKTPASSTSVDSNATLRTSELAPQRQQQNRKVVTQRHVDFAPQAQQLQFDPNDAVATVPNGRMSRQNLNIPLQRQSCSLNQTPMIIHGPSDDSYQCLHPQQQIFVPGSSHGVTVLPSLSSQQQSDGSPMNDSGFVQLPSAQNQNFSSNVQTPVPIPDGHISQFAFQQAVNNAYMLGQQMAMAGNQTPFMATNEVTVTKDRMIAPAIKLKSNLQSVDNTTAGRQVSQRCLFVVEAYIHICCMFVCIFIS